MLSVDTAKRRREKREDETRGEEQKLDIGRLTISIIHKSRAALKGQWKGGERWILTAGLLRLFVNAINSTPGNRELSLIAGWPARRLINAITVSSNLWWKWPCIVSPWANASNFLFIQHSDVKRYFLTANIAVRDITRRPFEFSQRGSIGPTICRSFGWFYERTQAPNDQHSSHAAQRTQRHTRDPLRPRRVSQLIHKSTLIGAARSSRPALVPMFSERALSDIWCLHFMLLPLR